jgi:predicted lipoprotein with Yx(FWY)xxD motif
VAMKKGYLFVTVLAGLAVAATACAPSGAAASSASQGASGNYGYGSSVQATAAPTQAAPSDSAGYGSGATPEPTAVSGQSSGSQDLGAGYGPASGATTAPAQSGASTSTVNVADNSQYGSILVDQNGMTLYLFLNDTQGAGTSACSGGCAALWPALTATSPTAGAGVDAGKLGTITRSDGTMQVTYNGWPLYSYVPDTKAGDATGQGFKSVWYVVAPSGDAVK